MYRLSWDRKYKLREDRKMREFEQGVRDVRGAKELKYQGGGRIVEFTRGCREGTI